MDVHTNMKGIAQQQLEAAHREDQKYEKAENVHFLSAWADPTTGKVFWLSEAPSRDAIQRVHEKAGHKYTEVCEVPLAVK